ncbi:MAG: metalloregulator ArsR/SmtB family transcription factor [Christensenellaceae bacterium]|jgi:ArsR family transcriptional regulator|nr:metalloregulator ArsR/SmtB family transcription factor [Christensenellaceae bacterium]
MKTTKALKAIADDSRMEILKLLLHHNYCVRALANELHLTEATVSQHLKVLREVGMLVGEKRGYYMHYQVEREELHKLAAEISALAEIEYEACKPDAQEDCPSTEKGNCHKKGKCSEETKEFCHGKHTGHDSSEQCSHGKRGNE